MATAAARNKKHGKKHNPDEMEISEPKKSSKNVALIILPKDDRDELSTTDFKARIGASLPVPEDVYGFTRSILMMGS